MTRKLFILLALLLTASAAVAFTIRVGNATANAIIVTLDATEPPPEPSGGGLFSNSGQLFDNGGGLY